MALIGLWTGFVAVLLADLRGTDTTRPWTRRAFGAALLVEIGAPQAVGGAVVDVATAVAGVMT